MSTEVLLLHDMSRGRRIRVARAALDLTQAELAAKATFYVREQKQKIRITPADVSYLEKEWNIPAHRMQAILHVLGLTDEA